MAKGRYNSKMKICNSCGKENPDDARFCSTCGSKLEEESNAGNRQAADISENEPEEAVFELEEKASEGDIDAALKLSKMYSEGIGVDKDPEKAALWLNVTGDGTFGSDAGEKEVESQPEPLEESKQDVAEKEDAKEPAALEDNSNWYDKICEIANLLPSEVQRKAIIEKDPYARIVFAKTNSQVSMEEINALREEFKHLNEKQGILECDKLLADRYRSFDACKEIYELDPSQRNFLIACAALKHDSASPYSGAPIGEYEFNEYCEQLPHELEKRLFKAKLLADKRLKDGRVNELIEERASFEKALQSGSEGAKLGLTDCLVALGRLYKSAHKIACAEITLEEENELCWRKHHSENAHDRAERIKEIKKEFLRDNAPKFDDLAKNAFECFSSAYEISPKNGKAAGELAECYKYGIGCEINQAKAEELEKVLKNLAEEQNRIIKNRVEEKIKNSGCVKKFNYALSLNSMEKTAWLYEALAADDISEHEDVKAAALYELARMGALAPNGNRIDLKEAKTNLKMQSAKSALAAYFYVKDMQTEENEQYIREERSIVEAGITAGTPSLYVQKCREIAYSRKKIWDLYTGGCVKKLEYAVKLLTSPGRNTDEAIKWLLKALSSDDISEHEDVKAVALYELYKNQLGARDPNGNTIDHDKVVAKLKELSKESASAAYCLGRSFHLLTIEERIKFLENGAKAGTPEGDAKSCEDLLERLLAEKKKIEPQLERKRQEEAKEEALRKLITVIVGIVVAFIATVILLPNFLQSGENTGSGAGLTTSTDTEEAELLIDESRVIEPATGNADEEYGYWNTGRILEAGDSCLNKNASKYIGPDYDLLIFHSLSDESSIIFDVSGFSRVTATGYITKGLRDGTGKIILEALDENNNVINKQEYELEVNDDKPIYIDMGIEGASTLKISLKNGKTEFDEYTIETLIIGDAWLYK